MPQKIRLSFSTFLLLYFSLPIFAAESGNYIEIGLSMQGEQRFLPEDISSSGTHFNFNYKINPAWSFRASHSDASIFTIGYLTGNERRTRNIRRDQVPEIDNWTEIQFAYQTNWMPETLSVGLSAQRLDFEYYIPGYDSNRIPIDEIGPNTFYGPAVHLNWHDQLSERWSYKVDISYLNVWVNDARLQGEIAYKVSSRLSLLLRIRDYSKFTASFHEVGIRYLLN